MTVKIKRTKKPIIKKRTGVTKPVKKKMELHPALAANAERLKNGESLHGGTKKPPTRKPRPTSPKKRG